MVSSTARRFFGTGRLVQRFLPQEAQQRAAMNPALASHSPARAQAAHSASWSPGHPWAAGAAPLWRQALQQEAAMKSRSVAQWPRDAQSLHELSRFWQPPAAGTHIEQLFRHDWFMKLGFSWHCPFAAHAPQYAW